MTPEALPDDAILLHIGPHKTGTTAIQGMLATAREQLTAHGVTYPGRYGAHHTHARALTRNAAGWQQDQEELPPERLWKRFARNVSQTPGRVVISSEIFGQADAEERARLVDDLGAERLHVLVAARNPGSIALSTWQQVLRDGKAGRLDRWLEQRFRRETPVIAESGFWSWADAATLVEKWSRVLDLDRINVVVVDEQDKALLPTTFEGLLGLPSGVLTGVTPPLTNRSLTASEAELLRRTLDRTRSELTWDEFSLFYRKGFSRHLLDARKPPKDEPRPVLPSWAADQAAHEAEWSINRLRESGVRVFGDLDNLRRVPAAADEAPIDTIPTDLAATAVAGVVFAAQKRIRAAERGLAESTAEAAADAAPERQPGQAMLDEATARQLASALGGRVRARLGRGVRRGGGHGG